MSVFCILVSTVKFKVSGVLILTYLFHKSRNDFFFFFTTFSHLFRSDNDRPIDSCVDASVSADLVIFGDGLLSDPKLVFNNDKQTRF